MLLIIVRQSSPRSLFGGEIFELLTSGVGLLHQLRGSSLYRLAEETLFLSLQTDTLVYTVTGSR